MTDKKRSATGDTGDAHSAAAILRRRAESLAQEAEVDEYGDSDGVLLFRLGEEWYGVRVGDVREIYQEFDITQIPCVPDFILGIVNIRGEIVSVTDIARLMRLGSLETELALAPAIVVHKGESATAIVVDEIGDIAEVALEKVEPSLSNVDRNQAEFVVGSVYLGDRIIGLVNVDRVLEPIGAAAR